MKTIRQVLWASLAACTLAALGGCSSVPLDESAKDGTSLAEMDLRDSQARGQAGAVSENSIYFDFDSFAVKSEYMPLIERHARQLNADATVSVQIQGNTDSRGSREYNLALGQKRSQAVKQRLQLLGVPASRIEAVSFGREKPVAYGENEEAWAQNRRADIVRQ